MITKFIEPWVLFPGILVLVLVFLGVALWRTGTRARGLLSAAEANRIRRDTVRVRAVGGVLIGIAAVLYLVSTPLVSRVLLGGLERRVPPPSTVPSDVEAVVVLGGGVVADAPSEDLIQALSRTPTAACEPAALSPEAESRLIYGMRLARRLDVPIVVTGGRVLTADSVPPEAIVAQHLLLDLGFSEERIFVEDRSRTTAENARNTTEMFGFTRVVLVTSAYHMPRSIFAFESVGVSVVPAPAAFRTDRRPLRPIDAMPQARALYNSSVFVREMVGLLYYRLVM